MRAEATFRDIQVAFGSRGGRGGGGGGGGNGATRDLEGLFDLELDTEKNQYESGRMTQSADQRQRAIDEALQKLEQLASNSSARTSSRPPNSAGSRRCCGVRPKSFSARWSSCPATTTVN